MINFQHLGDDEISDIFKLSQQVEDAVKAYIRSLNSSPFDIADISLDFDSVEESVKELSNYFKEIDSCLDSEVK